MKRAFTLLEILVVIAIVCLLAALLFPVFAQAKNQARITSCISNLKQYGAATQLYQGDWEGLLPVGEVRSYRNNMGGGKLSELHWNRDMVKPLVPYGGGDAAFRCPQIDHLFVQRWVNQFPVGKGESRILTPLPTTVLAECHHHLTKGWSGNNSWQSYVTGPVTAREGQHLVLHADGSVAKVNAHSVRQFAFSREKGEDVWTPCEKLEICGNSFDIFPGEVWPPEWTVLPEDITIDFGRRE